MSRTIRGKKYWGFELGGKRAGGLVNGWSNSDRCGVGAKKLTNRHERRVGKRADLNERARGE